MSGYIYIVIEREFLQSKQDVAKIGGTSNIITRMSNYPKNSRLIYCEFVNNFYKTETIVFECFKKTFKQRLDIGREYFEGSFDSMVTQIKTIKLSPIISDCECENADCDKQKPTCFFRYDTYRQFLEDVYEFDKKSQILTKNILETFENYIDDKNIEPFAYIRGGSKKSYYFVLQFKKEFVSVIEEHYKIKEKKLKSKEFMNQRGFNGIKIK